MKELPVLVVLAFGVALLMKTFLLQMFYIPSESMVPTLLGPHHADGSPCHTCGNGDRVAVNKLAYRFREPRRGEVVVFIKDPGEQPTTLFGRVRSFLTTGLGVTTPPETDFIKRVIGLPGETIEVTKRRTWITTADGERFALAKKDEPYIRREGPNISTQEPLKIPAGQYFVMGDNRNSSSDSRVFGPIKREAIVGKAFVKIWPPTRLDVIDAPSYPNTEDDRAGSIPAYPIVALVGLLALPASRTLRGRLTA